MFGIGEDDNKDVVAEGEATEAPAAESMDAPVDAEAPAEGGAEAPAEGGEASDEATPAA